jgi:integrase/predicted DNA-binding transcriptional regulator AlpA
MRTAPGRPAAAPGADPGTPNDPLLTIEEVTAELRVSRAAFYRWRRQGAGPPVVRLPDGGVRVRRSALSQWLRRLEEETTTEEQGADGQLRREVLGHQEDRRQRQRRTVPGPVGGQRAGALQVVKNKTLADGFLDNLKDAARDRRPFSPRTGLPAAETTEREMVTWYEHARSYAEAKWPSLAPVSRRSVAEALVTVTIALSAKDKGAPEPRVLRRALFAWAFNPATCDTDPPREIALALGWAARASLPIAALDDPAVVRLALGACAKTLAGKPAAGSTQRRKRSVFYNALGYAVELGRLASNPIDRIQWTAPAVAQTVDCRVVVSPAQARKLLAAVRGLSDRGAHLEAFYGCLYYAALRPSEAVMLREADLYLPAKGWGRIVLAASASRAGTAWTDHGTSRQERGLKHRADNETRTIPIPPELVRLLRAHIKKYGTTPDGRVFQTSRGGIIQDSAYSADWAEARKTALTEAQYRSPLGRRPYDLRHAAVSLWLNSGVPATEVARRAGHGVAVLLKIYAHCIDGQADAANQRITDALGTKDTQPEPRDEEDGDSEKAS